MSSGFTGYATRFCDPALGFALGWNYWFKYIIVTPNNLTAASLVIQYWVPRDKVNPGAFIAVFLVVVVLINYFGVKFFGEFEFYLSSIKVLVILGLILLSLILACGGGPTHHATGFEYWKSPGAFKPYILGKRFQVHLERKALTIIRGLRWKIPCCVVDLYYCRLCLLGYRIGRCNRR